MIVLDTNVISEIMRGRDADAGVTRWLRNLPDQPVTTVINQAEILSGVADLPAGRRREELDRSARGAFEVLGMVLPLTPACAEHYAEIFVTRKQAGRPIGVLDALIASIARDADLVVATRDLDDFHGIGLELVNPWDE